jgi:hypothetical protein
MYGYQWWKATKINGSLFLEARTIVILEAGTVVILEARTIVMCFTSMCIEDLVRLKLNTLNDDDAMIPNDVIKRDGTRLCKETHHCCIA